MKKFEFSKIIVVFTGSVFLASLIYVMVFYSTAMKMQQCVEWSPVVSILPVTGGAFTTALSFYFNKAKAENNIKLKKSLIEYKYQLGSELGFTNSQRFVDEIDADFTQTEYELDEPEYNTEVQI